MRPAHVVAGSANPMPLATRPHGQATSCADFSGVRIEVVREVCSLLPGRKLLAYALQFALWRDVLAQHAKHPLHLVVGGGDQVYNDEVFTYSESLRHWLTLGKEVRGADVVLQAAFTELFWQCVPYWPVRALLHTPCSPFQGLLSHLPAICSCRWTQGPQSSHPTRNTGPPVYRGSYTEHPRNPAGTARAGHVCSQVDGHHGAGGADLLSDALPPALVPQTLLRCPAGHSHGELPALLRSCLLQPAGVADASQTALLRSCMHVVPAVSDAA